MVSKNGKTSAVFLAAIILLSFVLVVEISGSATATPQEFTPQPVQIAVFRGGNRVSGLEKLNVGVPANFSAEITIPTHNVTSGFLFWSETHVVADYPANSLSYQWVLNGSAECDLTQNGASATLTILNASEEIMKLCVNVLFEGVIVGYSWVDVKDPYTSPDIYFDAVSAPYSYLVETDGAGWYRAINGTSGSSSVPSTNATTTSQYCLDAINASAKGGKLTFKQGTFPIQNLYSYGLIEICGESEYTIFSIPNGYNGINIVGGNWTNMHRMVKIHDLSFNGGYIAINISYAGYEVHITNNYIGGFSYAGIYGYGGFEEFEIAHNNIVGSTFGGTNETGIFMAQDTAAGGDHYSTITDNGIRNCYVALLVQGTGNHIFSNRFVESTNGYGVYLYGDNVNSNQIIMNDFENVKYGVYTDVHFGTGTVDSNVVAYNYFKGGSGLGAYGIAFTEGNYNQAIGNSFYEWGLYSIYFGASSGNCSATLNILNPGAGGMVDLSSSANITKNWDIYKGWHDGI